MRRMVERGIFWKRVALASWGYVCEAQVLDRTPVAFLQRVVVSSSRCGLAIAIVEDSGFLFL